MTTSSSASPLSRERERVRVRARALRSGPTDAESLLWFHLRDRRLGGFKFRRQRPIGPYFADFTCVEEKLVIELDGGQHVEQAERDAERTACLEREGFRVLRFWNNDVLTQTPLVLEQILCACTHPHPDPLPPAGEGESQQGPLI